MGTSKPQGSFILCCFGRKAYWGSLELHHFPDASAVVRALSPDEPVILNRPHAAARAARFFVEKFPGTSLYAVKANPSPDLLRVLWDAGITHYDVASIAEVRLVRGLLPEATLCFMHPVKAEEAIVEAYFEHGVRTFSLDTTEELEKIIRATKAAGGRIVSVGTTTLRALESAALGVPEADILRAGSRDTDIFITPGFSFKVVDVLVTNFHLPKSTLMMLVSALAGYDHVKVLYQHAIAHGYRFFSYGDAMLIQR